MVGRHLVELLRRAVHNDVLALGADPVQPGTSVPSQAQLAAQRRPHSRLIHWLEGLLEGTELLLGDLGESRRDEDPLHGGRQGLAQVLHTQVCLVAHQDVHLIQHHSLATAQVVHRIVRVRDHVSEPPGRCDEHVGAIHDLLALIIHAATRSGTMHPEALAAHGRNCPRHRHDLLGEVRSGSQDQQLQALRRPSRLRRAEDVPLEEWQQVGQGLAGAGLVSDHRAAALGDVIEAHVLDPGRPRQGQGRGQLARLLANAIDVVPSLL
mmetsp:Transcript_32389/g.73831  ORF Transcript_32389/g.73831 Transcript_32389/m.73831 type:complete len:266 (+) Transcript_32389:1020-1817(+)